jgi:IclR family acetate operon transcriptional repressor
VRNKPPYSIASVDHALQLAALLQQEGVLRVTDAAERLGVSVSTAHRLLTMLVYRDFAVQDEDRRYRPGAVLRPAETAPVAPLHRIALPHMQRLREATGETINLTVLVGAEARIVATVESARVLRVGDRVGRTLPAEDSSGGRAMLAALPPREVAARYPEADLLRLRRDLAVVRRRGYAVNDQQTEAGLTAIGRAVVDASGMPVAALAIAMPAIRFDRSALTDWVTALSVATKGIADDLG